MRTIAICLAAALALTMTYPFGYAAEEGEELAGSDEAVEVSNREESPDGEPGPGHKQHRVVLKELEPAESYDRVEPGQDVLSSEPVPVENVGGRKENSRTPFPAPWHCLGISGTCWLYCGHVHVPEARAYPVRLSYFPPV